MNASNLPIFGILSLALTPFTALSAVLAVVIIETFVDKPGSVSLSTLLPGIGHATGKVIFVCVAESVAAAIVALLRRSLSILGLAANALLIGVFWYARFYKLGYDQDRGAAP